MASEAEARDVLNALLIANEDITARAVARALGVAPSTITRSPERAGLVSEAQREQARLRDLLDKADKSSKTRLVSQIAERDREIEILRRRVEVLTASHKAMLMAVLEHGGMAGYRRFFEKYDDIRRELENLGAVATADIIELKSVSEGLQ